MKHMNVQSLSLMMLISMAYAASITISPEDAQKALLKDINAEVDKAKKLKNTLVHMAESKRGHTCEDCFFYYAKNALEGLKENSLHNLTRHLDQYIKHHHNCTTTEKIEIHLHRLLNQTHECVCKALKHMGDHGPC